MKKIDFAVLLSLGALWGDSFLFMRMGAGAFAAAARMAGSHGTGGAVHRAGLRDVLLGTGAGRYPADHGDPVPDPAFGVLWGALLLGEPVSPRMLGGCTAILLGTALTTGLIGGSQRTVPLTAEET